MFNVKSISITIFLITFVNVIYAANDDNNENCDFDCPANDTEKVCVYDKDAVCFQEFPSKCVMERMKCIFERDYMIFIDDYCKIEYMSCKDKPFVQSPPEDGEIQGISYKETPDENIEVVFKNEADKNVKVKSKDSDESQSNESNSNESESNEKQ